jgi:Fe-S cluster biogenesis protein NfuA
MSFVDIALMAVIIAGAVYLLYLSVWKRKGHCGGCGSSTCTDKDEHKSMKR